MKNELFKIIQHYGVNAQQRKLVEEVFELQEAITQYETITNSGLFRSSDECEAKEHIAEEIADCYVMIEQFRLYYGISSEELKKLMEIQQEKLNEVVRCKNEE